MFDSTLPATATAIHFACAVLRRHRSGRGSLNPFVLPSFLLGAAPWIWPSPTGVMLVLAVHALWLVACEVLAPAPPPPRAAVATAIRATPSRKTPAPAATSGAPKAGAPFVSTAVLAVLDETPDIKTFRLARPAGFDFVPGQFVPVRVQIDGKPHVRCYSLSSSPDARGYIEVSVRRQGLVSGTLHALLKPGSPVSIGRPAGRFVYPAGDDRPVALVAGGIGITPMLSMLRFALASDPTRPVTLLYSARHEHDVAFLSELRMIAERHPQVRVAITVTQPTGDTRWRTGRIDAAMLRQYVANPALTIFCLCGPRPMIAQIEATLRELGVPGAQVRSEEFETAVAASSLHAPEAATLPAAARDVPDAGGVRVTFAVSGRTVTASASVSLLEAAEAEGIPITSSCRSGVCQACRTRVVEGDVDCRSDMLDPADREAGFVLPCVSWAGADCTLEA